ncbi:GNAT family N-acetyltransferase [Ammoniphilus resinae]|uniref:GNAT superfamily N-acetyltransferase n=1 Tax=Ammoniphilus resinae TaxID=861532 RepID=A0ABS4GSR5_9BACL|nr:GNAT family N-acetyltransferase [Ammoniphilus resinae]MBP1932890.1 GNAT superfamily N-acetyltransferase [Ammoniphilus resinae]
MYLRKWMDSDGPYLIALALHKFQVEPVLIRRRLNLATEVLVLCEDNHDLVGYLCYRLRDQIFFVDLAILDPKHIGKGIAGKFFPAIIEHARQKGAIAMRGMVHRSNKQAFAVFKHWGFAIKRPYLTTYLIEKRL